MGFKTVNRNKTIGHTVVVENKEGAFVDYWATLKNAHEMLWALVRDAHRVNSCAQELYDAYQEAHEAIFGKPLPEVVIKLEQVDVRH